MPAFTLDLGAGEGPRYVWVSFRGMDNSGQPGPEVWRRYDLVLDTTPPALTITEPVNPNTSQPVLQVRGRANEALEGLSFELVNAQRTLTTEPGILLGPIYDEQAFMQEPPEGAPGEPPPLGWQFQLFDVTLAAGANTLTLRATDLAGNTTVLPLTLTLDLTSDTTPPAITLHWPLDGTAVAADTFDLRGQVDDPCATVSVSGLTDEPVEGLVERDGRFWVEGLPLPPGSHTLTVTATDAAGNTRNQTFTISRSPVTLTVHEPTEAELAQASLTLTGTISDGGYAVWVNGVRAGLTPNGAAWDWQAEAVPLGEGGTAVLQARAIPLDHNAGAGDGLGPAGSTGQGNPSDSAARDTELQRDRPARVYTARYFESLWHTWPVSGPNGPTASSRYVTMRVNRGQGGFRQVITRDGRYGTFTETRQTWGDLTDDGECVNCQPPDGWTPIPEEYCAVSDVQPGSGPGTYDRYTRQARTTRMLDTGGKKLRARRHLFTLWAEAHTVRSPRAEPPYSSEFRHPAYGFVSPLEARQIRLPGQALGEDGRLYRVLPDGERLDLTPQTPDPFYLFSVGATKHKLVLTADGHDLDKATPEFCVGERVDFVARLEPPLDPAALRTSYPQWFLPGKFVNKSTQASSEASENFSRDDKLLQAWDAFCWYVNEPGGTVHFGAGLQFKNGQYVNVTGKGELSIYRPLVSYAVLPPPANVNLNGTWLELGPLDESRGTYDMRFEARVTSSCSGNAAFTQLVKRHVNWPYTSTGGDYWLDKARFYKIGDDPDSTPVVWSP